MSVIVFEDTAVSQLNPVAIGRPAFCITCGGYRLIDLLRWLDVPVCALVRPHLCELVAADLPGIHVGRLVDRSQDQPLLLVNARAVPSVRVFNQLAALHGAGRPGVVKTGQAIAAAVLPGNLLRPAAGLQADGLEAFLAEQDLAPLVATIPLIEYPHDVIRYHLDNIAASLEHRIQGGEYREVDEGVFLADNATLSENVTTDTSDGPIVIDSAATVGPHSLLAGPIYIGPKARILEHAAIKDAVSIGHTAKIGGEVEASIVEPYTNKQHHGFLGHSYLGSWINLGAGTCNSDLKNTYGTVNMDYGGSRVPTNMQFVGVMLGDYAKSAINTGIFTGKTIGVCSMVYGFVTTNVPSFVNYARHFGQVTATPVEVMVATQKRMFARRDVTQRPCDVQLIRDMFDLTAGERQLGSVPLEPLSL